MVNSLRKNALFRFLIVGALGTVVNLAVFFILSDLSEINYNLSSILAFSVAVTQNYILNELWGFAGIGASRLNIRRYIVYVSGNLIGLLVNVGLLNLLLALAAWKLKTFPQAVAIASATVVNFLWAKIVVFKKTTEEKA